MNRILELLKDGKAVEDFIKCNKDILIKVAAVAAVIIVAFFVFTIKEDNVDEIKTEDKQSTTQMAKTSIYVDIGGEVNKPMLAELDEGSRVEDAIKAAGGLTSDANMSSINRAAFVEDGEKIFIPSLSSEGEETGDVNLAFGGKININTADSTQLQELTGVGPVTAESIIQYREDNGRYRTIEDLKNVSGIGDKTFEKLKADITV